MRSQDHSHSEAVSPGHINLANSVFTGASQSKKTQSRNLDLIVGSVVFADILFNKHDLHYLRAVVEYCKGILQYMQNL